MYETDEQQSDALYQWIQQHLKTIIAIFVLIFGSYGAWELWEDYHIQQSKKASVVFHALVTQLNAQASPTQTQPLIHTLTQHYPKTPYAQLAQLLKVHDQLQHNESDKAIQTLEQLIHTTRQPALRDIARIRLARIALNQQNISVAQRWINDLEQRTSSPIAWMIKGQISTQQHDLKAAHAAYLNALKAAPSTPEWSIFKDNIHALSMRLAREAYQQSVVH